MRWSRSRAICHMWRMTGSCYLVWLEIIELCLDSLEDSCAMDRFGKMVLNRNCFRHIDELCGRLSPGYKRMPGSWWSSRQLVM